jgi:hypothetical protein
MSQQPDMAVHNRSLTAVLVAPILPFGPGAVFAAADIAETTATTTQPAGTGNASSASAFSDVQSHRAYDAIEFVVSAGLFNGVSAGSFEPNSTMTRVMFATVLSGYADGTATRAEVAVILQRFASIA